MVFIKQGAFEVVKRDLKGLDDQLLTFLRQGDIKKKISKQVLLLKGRKSVYRKVQKHFPVFK